VRSGSGFVATSLKVRSGSGFVLRQDSLDDGLEGCFLESIVLEELAVGVGAFEDELLFFVKPSGAITGLVRSLRVVEFVVISTGSVVVDKVCFGMIEHDFLLSTCFSLLDGSDSISDANWSQPITLRIRPLLLFVLEHGVWMLELGGRAFFLMNMNWHDH